MKKKKARFVFASLLIVSILCSMCLTALSEQPLLPLSRKVSDPEKQLKWVEFNVPYEPLKQAMDIDVDSYQDRIHVSWIDLLAYLGARYGGDFSQRKNLRKQKSRQSRNRCFPHRSRRWWMILLQRSKKANRWLP